MRTTAKPSEGASYAHCGHFRKPGTKEADFYGRMKTCLGFESPAFGDKFQSSVFHGLTIFLVFIAFASALADVVPPPAKAQLVYPELALPENGWCQLYTSERQVARFKVSAPEGTHYWVKLVDASTSAPSVVMFVRAGSTAEVKVPLGTYVVKYAGGKNWYGQTHLFGPDTAYGKSGRTMQFWLEGNIVHGHSITLYKVRNGNLQTQTIPASEF